jgi:G3E family GTPase
VVDAVNGVAALDARERAVRQVAVADRIVLSKTDLADPPELRARLRRLNPAARVVAGRHGALDPSAVFGAGLFGPAGTAPDVRAWLDAQAFDAVDHAGRPVDPTGCDAGVQAFCLTFDRALPWRGVIAWLERLILTHGDAVLRMKGILQVQAQDPPVAIHSVGHLLYPPIPLAAWPKSDPRNSRLMFITRDLPRAAVEAGMPIVADASAVGQDAAAAGFIRCQRRRNKYSPSP